MDTRIVRLSDLTPEQRRLILALVAADKAAKADKERLAKAGSGAVGLA